ncbi:MAG: SDR family NAD(P)-dependent oxidoreductase [Myxococcales bacterium]|nr:SDR family NAD(P)-dependent oxidoreductase [Myxococcales bacterium]
MVANVLLTGANGGIGRLTALALAERGHRVFGTMREIGGANRAAALELVEAARSLPGSLMIFDMELASQRSVEGAVAQVLAVAGHLDAVVGAAGLTTMGLAETMTDQQVLYQLDVNLVGPHRVLRAVLPSMRARRAGVLIHVSDVLGRVSLPLMGIHCAGKAALEALVDAYRHELAPLGIESTLVQPGFFPTGFVERLEVGDDHARMAGYDAGAARLDRLGDAVRRAIMGDDPPDPRIVADTIVTLVELEPGSRPDRFVVDGRDGAPLLRMNDAYRRAQAEVMAALGLPDEGDS